MIDTLQDVSGGGLSGLIATSMPPEEARPSWLQHPMRHLLKKIASGDTEEGAHPAEPRGMLSTPIPTDFSRTNSPPDGGASAIRPAAVEGSQVAPLSAFGSLAPILPQPVPARPAVVPDAPADIPAAVRRGMVGSPSTRPATPQEAATITVHAPDGSIFAFPAGTSAATINEAMSRHFGGTKASPTNK
jgi:hypothetical protein